MLECVVNVSEGRDPVVLAELAQAAGPDLLDRHADRDHHRSVFTLVGMAAPRRLAAAALERLNLRPPPGVHTRLGVAARDAFAAWLADEFAVPCFVYGPERSLPEVRRHAFGSLAPDVGPPTPHPTAGACCVGARPVMVAYNVWLAEPDLARAREIAAAVRSPTVRALGLSCGDRVQVSMNLVAPEVTGPAEAYDAVAAGARVAGAELVGLVPAAVLDHIPPSRWRELDLDPDRTIEARLAFRP
jgi:glutamate formiminotransferase